MDTPRKSPPAPAASLPSTTTSSSAAVSRAPAAPADKMTPAATSTSAPAPAATGAPRPDVKAPALPATAAAGLQGAAARPPVVKPRPASTAAPAAAARPAGSEARPPAPGTAAAAAKPALTRTPSHTAASTLQALASAASSAPQARPIAPVAKPAPSAAAGSSAAARLPGAAGGAAQSAAPMKKPIAAEGGADRPRPLGAGADAARSSAVASGSALKSKPAGAALPSVSRPAVAPGPTVAAAKTAPAPKPSPASDKALADKVDKASAKADKAEKRRKANRACSACQKAHLTCDDSRPCQRCVKKGLQDSCTDGARKKAKYLLDEDEILALKREKEERKKGKTERRSGMPLNGPMRSDSHTSDTLNILPNGAAGSNDVDEEMHSEWGTESAFDQQSVISHMPAGMFGSTADTAAGMTSGAGEQSPDYFAGMSAYSPGIGDGVNGSGSAFGADPYGGVTGDVYQGPIEFGSETTSLEYSFLSSMLHSIDPHLLRATPDTDATSNTNSGPGANLPHLQMGNDSLTGWRWEGEVPAWQAGYAEPQSLPLQHATSHQAAPQQQQHLQQQQQAMPPPQQPYSSSVQLHAPHLYSSSNTVARPATVGYGSEGGGVRTIHAMDGAVRHASTSSGGAGGSSEGGYGALEVPSPAGSVPSSAAATLAPEPLLGSPSSPHDATAGRKTMDQDAVWKERVKHVYSDRCKPFPYTEGYHFLLKHVTAKFEKQEVLRIVRALAIFRPSLIALQMPLTEDDEVFVERSILRTVLELEKLISFSGTPTVVWRRTCEIAVVGMEFCMLTQRTRESLLGKYIYEFLDKASTLEYWEAFALHAFEASAQSIMMPVSLVGGSGNLVKCAACFSIKRDVFDLPSLVVANFLPIL